MSLCVINIKCFVLYLFVIVCKDQISDLCLCYRLAGKSPNLRVLDLRNCNNISWESVVSLPATKLQHLYLTRTVNQTLDVPLFALLSKVSYLRSLVMQDHQ